MELHRQLGIRTFIVLTAAVQLLAAVFGVLTLLSPGPATAAQTIPYKVNFQGRLTDNSGNVLADGSYNIKFRFFNAASSGANLWQEDRTFTGVDRRIAVQNGLFNVQFGDVTALAPGLFNTATNPNLWLEVELPTPATATCATNGCAVFTEGAMTPRQVLASSPYAFNSDTLDGLDATAFGQLSGVQSWTDTNTFSKSGGAGLILSGTAASAGTQLQFGSVAALSSGSASGTYLGANPASYSGDLINFQINNAVKLKVNNTGSLTLGTGATITIGASTGVGTSCTGGQVLQDQSLVGGIVTGGTCATPAGTGASTALSNLTATSINQSLVPNANNTRTLGSAAAVWQNVYTGNLDAGTTTTTLAIGTAATTTGVTLGRSGVAVSVPGGLTTSGANITTGAGTINTATISGGSLTGGTVSGGTLSATAVNGLSASATAIQGTSSLTIDGTSAGTVSIGSVSTGDVLLAGGSGAGNGCTITNSNGNLACTGTITGTGSGLSSLNPSNLTTGSGAVTLQSAAGTATIITSNAAATWSTTGANNLTLDSGGGNLVMGTTTTAIQKNAAAFALDLATAGTSTLTVRNSNGANVANLTVTGNIATTGTGTITSAGAISAPTSTNTINNLVISSGSLSNVGNITGAGALTLASTTNALTLTSGSGTVVLGSSTVQRAAAGLTLDVNNAAASTLTVTNSNASFVANLSVEGGVGIGTGQIFSVGATNGVTISACTSAQYLTGQAATGGLVTGGSCVTNDLQNTYSNSASPATISLTDAKNFIITSPELATDPSVLFNLQCTTCSASGGRFAVQDNGADILTVNPNGQVVVAPTAGQNMAINLAGNSGLAIAATSAPTIDQVSISNIGQPVAAAGVSGLQINYVGGAVAASGEASAQRIDVTPGSTNPSTWNGLRIADQVGAAAGVNFNGIKLEGPAVPGGGTEIGLNITTGWDVGVNVQSGGLQLAAMADPTPPTAGNIRVYAKLISGRTMLKALGSSGIDFTYQPSLFQQNIFMATPGSVGATLGINAMGSPITMGAGTYTNSLAGSQSGGFMANWSTGATAGTVPGFMQSVSQYYRGSIAGGSNGFFVFSRVLFPDTASGYLGSTGVRFWNGLSTQATMSGMTSSDTPTGDYAGFRLSGGAGETTFRFLTRNNATTTNTNTGVTLAQNKEYDLYFYVKPFSATDATQNQTIYWRIDNLTDGIAPVEGSVTATLPTAATALRFSLGMQNLTGVSRNFRFQRVYVETDR